MPRNIIHHNPHCSKSRETLRILQERGIRIPVNEYLKTPPSIEELRWICLKLGIRPRELARTGHELFEELSLSLDDSRSDDEWLVILHQYPSLIERPIVVYNGKVVIGRPPEKVLTIID